MVCTDWMFLCLPSIGLSSCAKETSCTLLTISQGGPIIMCPYSTMCLTETSTTTLILAYKTLANGGG